MINEEIAYSKENGMSDEEIAYRLVYYYGQVDAFGTPVTGFDIGYALDADGKFLTDEYGCADVQTLMEEFLKDMSLEAILKGDATDDGKVNLSDAAAMPKLIAKWNVNISEEASDVNADSKVNLSDVSTVLKHIAGWNVEFVY